MTHSVDRTALLGLRRRGAALLAVVFLVGQIATAVGHLDDVDSAWPVWFALAVSCLGGAALVRIDGDPLPRVATVSAALAGPVAAVLVTTVLHWDHYHRNTLWFFNTAAVFAVFLAWRGRPVSGVVSLAVTTVVVGIGAARAHQNFREVLSPTAWTIGALIIAIGASTVLGRIATSITRVRNRDPALAAAECAARARLDERDTSLAGLDTSARPMLDMIASGIPLSDADRRACGLLEAQLRDAVRARALSDASVHSAARSARSRGVQVILLDDGGLDSYPEEDLVMREQVRDVVVEELHRARSGIFTARIFPPGRELIATILVDGPTLERRITIDHRGRMVVDANAADGDAAIVTCTT